MLSPPPAISLAPQMPCLALEMPHYFRASPYADTHITMAHSFSIADRLTHRTDIATGTLYRQRRSSLPSEVPLNLTISASKDLDCPAGGTLSRPTMDTLSSTSIPFGGLTSVAESAVNITNNIMYSTAALLLASNPAAYVSSLFNSGLATYTTTSVAATSGNSDDVLRRSMFDQHPSILSTAAAAGTVTDASLSQMSVASADGKQMTVDAATLQHRDSVVRDVEQYSSPSELFSTPADSQCFSSPNVDVRTMPTITGNMLDQMQTSVTVSTARCLVQESLQPSVSSSSQRFVSSGQAGISCPEISQASIASNSCSSTADTAAQYPHESQVSDAFMQYPRLSQVSETFTQYPKLSQVSDTVAHYSQQSDISEPLPPELQSAAAPLLCPVTGNGSPVFTTSVPIKHDSCDIVQSETTEADVCLFRMGIDAEVNVYSSSINVADGDSSMEQCSHAAVESSLCRHEQPILVAVKQDGAASSDMVTDTCLAVASAVHNKDDAVIKSQVGVTAEGTSQQHDLLLLNRVSEQHAEASGMEPISDIDAVQKSFSETKPDSGPGFDDKKSSNALDAGSKAADAEVITGDTPPVSAVSTVPSENICDESQPPSEPALAVVAMEMSTPAASASQQHSTGNAGDVSAATASAETDKNERFKELMIKCTKALELCLARFPQHYKSLYRLADVFYRCSCLKVSLIASNISCDHFSCNLSQIYYY